MSIPYGTFVRAIAVVLGSSLVLLYCAKSREQRPDQTRLRAERDNAVVTPVQGPSWLKHLGIEDTRNSSMGRMGGSEEPPASQRSEPGLESSEEQPNVGMGMGRMMGRIYSSVRTNPRDLSRLMNERFTITGADLYRLNCQSCHGPKGNGAPPEIKPLLGPVQGASVVFIKERMARLGRTISDSMAQQLARQAEGTIRDRLQNGGQKMPPFHHLDEEEVDALLQYLRTLAGVQASGQKPILVSESVARVGEHLVKGTCHTCHDATGPGGGHMAMMSGVIPSLASFPREQSMPSVVRQVELGSTSMMAMMNSQTMPAMPFITEDEAAAGYLYLAQYPPE
jgi:mono/diheme cytochrome c family protein